MVIYRSIPGNGGILYLKAGLTLGYRTNSGLLAAVDFTWNDLITIGYDYDAGMTEFSGISRGSHEFLLGFRVCKPTREKAPKEPEIINLAPIRFELNSAKLTPVTEGELNKVAKVLEGNSEMRIEIRAHTDCTGSEEANLRHAIHLFGSFEA